MFYGTYIYNIWFKFIYLFTVALPQMHTQTDEDNYSKDLLAKLLGFTRYSNWLKWYEVVTV